MSLIGTQGINQTTLPGINVDTTFKATFLQPMNVEFSSIYTAFWQDLQYQPNLQHLI